VKKTVGMSALLLGIAASSAFAEDTLMKDARETFKAIPLVLPEVKGNPVTREKVELGKMLFFDPRLSASGLISCNTCHNLGMGGDDNQVTSVGHGWAKGPRNAPTVLNAVFNVAQFWDGRAEDLKAQAKGPIQAGVEMNSTPDLVIKVLKSMPDYVGHFERSFPGEAEPVTFDNVAKAIEAFEATMITPASRFDQFLEGNAAALTDHEKEGLRLFMAKGCSGCHNGVNVGGGAYYAFGVIEKPGAEILPAGDKGRFAVTKTAADEYVFRAPPLRNVALTAPYFHSGNVWNLKQAVAVMGSSPLGETLSDDETDAIAAFLGTLTGEQPKVEYPLLPTETAATPRPEPMRP
jgi:cytochrome c peroxidase